MGGSRYDGYGTAGTVVRRQYSTYEDYGAAGTVVRRQQVDWIQCRRYGVVRVSVRCQECWVCL